MDLKDFQRRVVQEADAYLRAVAKHRAAGNTRHASKDAWVDLRLGRYDERTNGVGEDLTTFCVKVPTGGGKTLLATQILGAAYGTILQDRNGAGLVVWVVPTSQIYRDTLKALRDRDHLYRRHLEHALSRRIEVWEKHEISRLSPAKLRDCLNVLVIQLASTNRQTKEDLKFFRDSGGNIVDHFPPETDYEAHRKLKERMPNLEMLAEDAGRGEYAVKTSIANLVRLCKPAVILDESHKGTSALARETIEGFNASLVVELSATPKAVKRDGDEIRPSIICRVSGHDLLKEQMIKLPINVATSGQKDWKDVLTQANDRRKLLAKKAMEHAETAGPSRLIRPMIVVQVERTGKEQREAGLIHSEQVKEYLTQTLGVIEAAIKIKTAEIDELSDIDNLMDPLCPVEWIITKSALQEGWDCPFAYILVSLNNTGSLTGMTQLVGRVLRQPYQERVPDAFKELNESYVYCLHARAAELTAHLKKALEQEGLEDATGMIVNLTDPRAAKADRVSRMKSEFAEMYRPPHAGKIYLPRFCVKTKGGYEPLDYFRHLVATVDVDQFPYDTIDWHLAKDMADAKDRFYRLGLESEVKQVYATASDNVESDAAAQAWIAASLSFDWLSYKQLRRIVAKICERLESIHLPESVKDRFSLVKFVVRDRIQEWTEKQIDAQTKITFERLHANKKLDFYVACAECRSEIPQSLTLPAGPHLRDEDDDLTRKSLFDYVPASQHNTYERSVALCLDRDKNVLWWYRNLVGEEGFWTQGYKRARLYWDFIAQSTTDCGPQNVVWVIEPKGEHLVGNADTNYKREVMRVLSEVGEKVSWQQLGEEFKKHRFEFRILDESLETGQGWEEELRALMSSCAV